MSYDNFEKDIQRQHRIVNGVLIVICTLILLVVFAWIIVMMNYPSTEY